MCGRSRSILILIVASILRILGGKTIPFLILEMGQIVYPSYEIKKSCPIFEARKELLEYEVAYNFFNEIYAATDNGQWEVSSSKISMLDDYA